MKRREFLAASLGLLSAAPLAGCDDHGASRMPKPSAPVPGPDGKLLLPWQNWSGYQSCLPAARVAPENEDQLAELLRTSKGPIRPVGAGHSFTPLVPTDGTIVSLRNFEGLVSHDADTLTATFGGGTKIGQIGEPLDAVGQALQNMPDIDEQTIAGAISTGTHGTGQELGALHSFVTSLRLVTPRGNVLDCSATQNREIFDAARVSLGSLGIITQVTLQNVPSHRLKRKVWIEPLDALIGKFDQFAGAHHSFEMYFLPFCDWGIAISIDPTDDPVHPRAAEQDNDAVMELKGLRDWTSWLPALRRFLLRQMAENYKPEETVDMGYHIFPSDCAVRFAVDVWYRVFPSERTLRFNEMEYHLPREQLLPTLKVVRERIEKHHPEEFFPVEVRVVKGDDAWLSPFHGHDRSGSIAVHRYYVEDPLPYFADIEPIYQPLGGRPHWGKMNTLDAAVFAERYPRWKEFLAVREALDPDGKMLNPYLKKVFGLG